jgi:hypothetical protein
VGFPSGLLGRQRAVRAYCDALRRLPAPATPPGRDAIGPTPTRRVPNPAQSYGLTTMLPCLMEHPSQHIDGVRIAGGWPNTINAFLGLAARDREVSPWPSKSFVRQRYPNSDGDENGPVGGMLGGRVCDHRLFAPRATPPSGPRSRTRLWRESNQSLSHSEFLPGKRLPRAETGAAFSSTPADCARQGPRYPASAAAKPRKVKDYSDGRTKAALRGTA